jgi:Ni/Co efflux regulator RcnB
MNNKFSDIDKAIITAWLFFGAGVGVLVAPLFHVSFWASGAMGLFAGAFVDYILFFEPWRGTHAPLSSTDNDEQQAATDDEEADLSEFIRDSFEAEDLVPQDEIEFKNDVEDIGLHIDEGDADMTALEEDVEEDETLDDVTDDEINDEIDESDDEFDLIDVDEEALEEAGMEEDDLEEQQALPATYRSENQIHSSYDRYESNEPHDGKTWMKPASLLMILAGIWFFISQYITDSYPAATRSITGNFPTWFFTFLPILFLTGLSGLIGILFRDRDETLEMSAKENAAYLFNLLKIFTGWGVGLYAILVNL